MKVIIFIWDSVSVHYRGMRVSSKRGSTSCNYNFAAALNIFIALALKIAFKAYLV